MTTIDDVRADILEALVYEGALKDGEPLELTATLLDLHRDSLPLAGDTRERGASAFGMLFFDTNSPAFPKLGVTWQRFDSGLELTPDDSERHFLDDKAMFELCIDVVVNFLRALAEKDAKYAGLAPPAIQ